MAAKETSLVFDYRALRLLMGLIALTLPFIVWAISSTVLSSISASYHTEARDTFVGMLFVVSAFLWAYNGHSLTESSASKAAAVAAMLVALFPTSCDACKTSAVSVVHYVSAALLFSILAYFCFVPFRLSTRGKGGKKGLRSKIYWVCGWIMVFCMLSIVLANFALSEEAANALSGTFWAEGLALCAFGTAWIVSGKYLRLITDEDEALRIFATKSKPPS